MPFQEAGARHIGVAKYVQRSYTAMANQIGWVVIVSGALVLLSWLFDFESGKRVLPNFESMKLNTALCFIACGLMLKCKSPFVTAPVSLAISGGLACFVLVVSGLTLVEYAFGWRLGIDNLVVRDETTLASHWPGRMSVGTALCFIMLGAGWLASLLSWRLSILATQLLALAVIMISCVALIGYVFGIQHFSLFIFSTMALHTAALFVLCGAGMLLVHPEDGLMRSATSPYVGGRTLRRWLPFICITPVVTGWLSLQGVTAGLYTEAFGFVLSSLSSILVLGFVGWVGADALNREEERFRSTIDSSPVATIMVDEDGIIRMANRLANTVFRYPDGHLVGLPVERLIPSRFRSHHAGYRNEYMFHPEQRIMGAGRELFAMRHDGTEFRAEIALNPVRTADTNYVMAAIVDITERVESEQKIMRLSRIHKVLSGINTLIVRAQTSELLCDEATRITVEEGELPAALVVQYDSESGRYETLHAYSMDSRLDTRHLSDVEIDALRQCLERKSAVVRNDLADQKANDDSLNLAEVGIGALAAFPLASLDHRLEAAFLIYRREPFSFDQSEMTLLQEVAGDISFAIENLARSQQLEYLTHFDNVTALPNRLLLTDRLQQAILQADSYQSMVSILYLDIDRFKQVNDSLGHTGGDDVLRQVAQRIRSCVTKADTVSRWGGDEFIVLLPEHSIADAAEVANTITSALHSLMVLDDGRELFVSCSIGIAEHSPDGGDTDSLINNARDAMTGIKEYGGNDYRHFVPDSRGLPYDGLAFETSLRHALSQEQFQLYYQPQIDIASREVVGLEALLRWHHPTHGMVSPDHFIPLAERTGLIVPIGEWVLREACRKGAASPGLKMAVNLSARQFHQENLVAVIHQILEETGLLPANLELEITESTLIYDVESAIATMTQLINLGVNISLDDFGTGYSSLSYLKRFPIHTLKIDKAFVAEVNTDSDSEVIVNTIIVMAHSLGLNVIAEGVETDEQLEKLRERGCDQAQGYLFSRPLPYQEVIDAMRI
ncbi:sensor domain-containing protein [Onishia niordana]|uniref:sensor domain-containing protein n=1 Tax=Onishia niordana TaxID=2508711 RepID=UPI0010A0B178|nr:EAL domain-containing protein [Halomonas niordiana]